MPPRFADPTVAATPLRAVEPDGLEALRTALNPAHRAWLDALAFTGAAGQVAVLPGVDGRAEGAVVGLGPRGPRFRLAAAFDKLPAGVWRLEGETTPAEAEDAALGWLLHGYRFDRYRKSDAPTRSLVAPAGVDAARLEAIAAGAFLTRDLVNTPANDMGPEALEAAARELASAFGAEFRSVVGDALIDENFPLIHAVGRAAAQAPRLLELGWGAADAPRLTLVGKGVCFDTGGLDIKPPSSMRQMKKDMGGAATALGLARMIMARDLPVRLRVLIPAVENSVSSSAFRPGDILPSRKGLTVEIGNTDAEGRLVLADALALACEDDPGLLIDFATLTGAARVALGPELPALFTDDEALATEIAAAAWRARDPVWRLPLWDGYDEELKSPVADLDNAPGGGFAGAITAALFLRRFVTPGAAWTHFDLFAWTPKAKPGRPLGGECQTARALFAMIEARHGCA
jgi:leucyl aminopeptidase